MTRKNHTTPAVIVLAATLFFSVNCAAGNSDSLMSLLGNRMHDTVRANVLMQLGEEALRNKPDTALMWFARARKLMLDNFYSEKLPALKTVYAKKFADSHSNIGYIHKTRSENLKAIQIYNACLLIRRAINDKTGEANTLNNLGTVLRSQGNIREAMHYYSQAADILKTLNDSVGTATIIGNIGYLHEKLEDYDAAKKHYLDALRINRLIGDDYGVSINLNNIGAMFHYDKQYDSALFYYDLSMKIKERQNDPAGLALCQNNIGRVYFAQKQYQKAQEYFNFSLETRKKMKDKKGVAYCLNNLGLIMLEEGESAKAIQYGKEALAIASEISNAENMRNAADVLYKGYATLRDFKNAFEMQSLLMNLKDSLSSAELKKTAFRNEMKFEYDRKAAADSVRTSEEKKVIQAQLKAEQTQRYSLYGGLGLVGLFAIVMVNRFRITNRQKKLIEEQKRIADEQKKIAEEQKSLIEEKQKEILDSIHYARRIQKSLMPNEKQFQKHLNVSRREK